VYKLSKLPPPVPYAITGRVYKKPETRKYYELIKSKIDSPPDWLREWEPGMWVRLTIQFIFATQHHGDPENYNKALVNGITQAVQKWNKAFDDKWILINQKKPIFAKKEGIIFEMEIVGEE
jgi:hypothetical protein